MRGHTSWKRPAWAAMAVVMMLGLSVEADAQGVASSPYMSSYRVSDYFASPGWYGTSYGFASYGFPQTYSVFSAYPGPSYGNELPPLRPHADAIRRGPLAAGICHAGICLRGFILPLVRHSATGRSR